MDNEKERNSKRRAWKEAVNYIIMWRVRRESKNSESDNNRGWIGRISVMIIYSIILKIVDEGK